MAKTVDTDIQQADALRKSLNWSAAAQSYGRIHQMQPKNAVVTHNLALCHLAQQHWEQAIAFSRQALRDAPHQWQSALLLAKALNKNKQQDQALQLLEKLHHHLSEQTDIRQELAHLHLHHLGNAASARQLITPLLGTHQQDAELLNLVSQLYDRAPAAPLNDAFLGFAPRHLKLPAATQQRIRRLRTRQTADCANLNTSKRLRIGLLSPQFFASPVYFFCIGALRHISQHADLVIFSRSHKQDWATQEFKSIASQWHQVTAHNAETLALHIAGQPLDALIDLGGWMDPVGLQALSSKLAPRQYKWVGGQSITTGLGSFDGFITDEHQTPVDSDALYSEPLLRLPLGYVTYTAPPYMPVPQAPRPPAAPGGLTLGITANPAKISRDFLADLAQRIPHWQQQRNAIIGVQFIDQRYQHHQARQRIHQALPGLPIEFVSPTSHRNYLNAIGQLDAIVDTFPYSAGLTTIEALALGVPTLTRDGQLFCERHTQSHNAYASATSAQPNCHIDHWDCTQPPRPTGTLLPLGSPRLNHAALGQALLETIHIHTP